MSMPVEKVEVGFDTSFSATGDFFTLDDATRGVLDNTTYTLAGISFIDVTPRVKDFSISRGRSNLFANFPAGQLNVAFNNHDRAFDPLYAQSPFVGNIVPRREIRVTTAGSVQYTGWIDDWSYSYLPNGDSVAEAIAYDATSILANQTLSAGTPVAQKTGARINSVLDQISWSTELRDIDTGTADLSAFPIEANQAAMAYLQTVASSEPGLLFVDRGGKVKFVQQTGIVDYAGIIFGGTGIPFQNLGVSYGSDNLYNQVIIAREGGGTVTASDPQSITDYGLRSLSASSVLLNSDADLVDLALDLVSKFSLPEYRFSSLEIALHKLDDAEQAQVLSLDLGSVVKVVFTPNNIGDPIERFVQIISINHLVRPETHFIEYSFEALEGGFWTLGDPLFGRLSTGNFLGF